LLLGWALYRRRRQARAETPDPATHDRLPPDSFFGGSGGQHIDTAEAASSMLYSPSQIDAAGDVDPVAEADVYLAYGRDLQAEEILREALRTTPQRVAIHAKLLEILARRNDPRAFEPLAREALALTGSSGPVWEQIASLGQEIDPGNPLYVQAGPDAAPAPEPTPIPPPRPAPAVPAGLDLDFASFPPPPVASPTEEAAGSPFDFGDEPTPAPSAVKADTNTLDFDLAGLSLELEEPARATPASGAGHEALATKLSLAEEFQAIGDADGARSLIQEVLAEAQGDLRRRAERMLAELG
jgi:pilus assembly protein FimV